MTEQMPDEEVLENLPEWARSSFPQFDPMHNRLCRALAEACAKNEGLEKLAGDLTAHDTRREEAFSDQEKELAAQQAVLDIAGMLVGCEGDDREGQIHYWAKLEKALDDLEMREGEDADEG